MDRAYLVYNRIEARGSDDNAGYWSNTKGWTTIDRATVFFEEDRRLAAALGPGAVTVESPAVRLSEARRAAWAERLEAGRVVYVHDPAAASTWPSARLPGLDGHYIVDGCDGPNLMLRGAFGSCIEVPGTMVFPSPLDNALRLLRDQVGNDDALTVEVHYEQGEPRLRVRVSNWSAPAKIVGPVVEVDACDAESLENVYDVPHPPVEWPLPIRAGDLVTWADPDDGAASCIAVARQGEDDCDDTCRLLRMSVGSELEAPLHELVAAPQTRMLHELRNALVRRLPESVFDALTFKLDTSPEALEDRSVARVQISGLAALDPAQRAQLAERLPGLWKAQLDTSGVLRAEAAIAPAIHFDLEAFDEHWGLIRPESGGFFDLEEIDGVNSDTLWTAIESDSGAVWLYAGTCAGNVLGYVRTHRPYVTTEEQVLLHHGAGDRPTPAPKFAVCA